MTVQAPFRLRDSLDGGIKEMADNGEAGFAWQVGVWDRMAETINRRSIAALLP